MTDHEKQLINAMECLLAEGEAETSDCLRDYWAGSVSQSVHDDYKDGRVNDV